MARSRRETWVGYALVSMYAVFELAALLSQFALDEEVLAVLLMVVATSISIAALKVAQPLTLRFRIIALCICYFGLTTIFASAHFLLFSRDRSAYAFADAVGSARLSATTAEARREMLTTQVQLNVLSAFGDDSVSMLKMLQSDDSTVSQGANSLRLAVNTYMMPPAGFLVTHTLFITTPGQTYALSGDIIGDPRAPPILEMTEATNLGDFRRGLSHLRSAIQAEHDHAAELVLQRTAVWEYSDFLYFSAVTITTVGFGDIVPANRAGRLLVGAEAMAGVFLVAFALTFFWPDRQRTSTE